MPEGTSPLLPLLFGFGSSESGVQLPPDSANIFHRIIRDPTRPDRPARERRCTEMLCSVLMNAPLLRATLLEWLADRAQQSIPNPEQLEWDIDTEQPVRSGRLDMLIRGYPPDKETDRPAVLWVVEVKAGAGFHESPVGSGEDETDEREPDTIHQVAAYDRWLARQHCERRAGFVLAPTDKSEALPEIQRCGWTCLTWAEMGRRVKDALSDGELESGERLLARHMVGFILTHLWEESGMGEERISFDHIALIRAMQRLGDECDDAVKTFMPGIAEEMENANLGSGEVQEPGRSFWSGILRSKVSQDVKKSINTTLIAGIDRDCIAVWTATALSSEEKDDVRQLVEEVLEELKARNPGWHRPEDSPRHDVELRVPLTTLLHVEDQEAEVRRIVREALEDLSEVRFIDGIKEVAEE